MKRFLGLAVALSLSACGAGTIGSVVDSVGTAPPPQAPPVVTTTALRASTVSWQLFASALEYINSLHLQPGTPKAKQLAAAIRKTSAALQALDAVTDATSSPNYQQALAKAQQAYDELRRLVG